MEYGENISQAAIREVNEETGLDIEIDYLVGIYTSPDHIIEFSEGEVRQEFSVLFACKLVGGDLSISKESIRIQWFTLNEIADLDMTHSPRRRLDDYLAKKVMPIVC